MKIKVKGEEYNLRITFGGMMRFKAETGKDLEQMNADMPMEDVYKFLLCCFKSCAAADNKNIDGIEMLNVMDSIDVSMMKELMNQAGMEMVVNNPENGEEKKS